MHSAWNSCPHGRLITLLTPSTYSSKQTTHSLCLPPYLRLHSAKPAARFSSTCSKLGGASSSDKLPEATGTSLAVLLLGRVCIILAPELGSRGVAALTVGVEIALVVLDGMPELGIVWYVRTGSRSTTDFGARHRLRRIRERSSRSAYTTVRVTSGETTRTSKVSKNGEEDIDVGVNVTHRPSWCRGMSSIKRWFWLRSAVCAAALLPSSASIDCFAVCFGEGSSLLEEKSRLSQFPEFLRPLPACSSVAAAFELCLPRSSTSCAAFTYSPLPGVMLPPFGP